MNNNSKKGKRLFIVLVCAFIAVAIAFGLTLGIITAYKNSKAAIKYNGLTMTEKEASYFLSYYKYLYMRYLSDSGVPDVEDTYGFWNKIDETENKSYGALLSESSEKFMRELMVSISLFDRYVSLSKDERKLIGNAAKNVLDYKADGSRDKFNSLSRDFGFEYDDFLTATKSFYKSAMAKSVIYGKDGSLISSYPDLCAKYLSKYSHVKLLFIRTNDKFLVDENGNRVMGNDGMDQTVPLSDSEKAQRAALISEIKSYIDAIDTGNVEMGSAMFDYYLENHDEGDKDRHEDGYYFYEKSDFTSEFREEFPTIVEKSLSMEKESYSFVELDFGVCFIYKYEPTAGAYASKLSEACFRDFYKDAANELYNESLEELSANVVLTERYKKIDIVAIPYNYNLVPNFN